MSNETTPGLREQIASRLLQVWPYDIHLNAEGNANRIRGIADVVMAVVQPEIDCQVRAVQGWMALDLHMALGLQVDFRGDVEHQGYRSWADWWAELCGKVRNLPGQHRAEQAEAANHDPREES